MTNDLDLLSKTRQFLTVVDLLKITASNREDLLLDNFYSYQNSSDSSKPSTSKRSEEENIKLIQRMMLQGKQEIDPLNFYIAIFETMARKLGNEDIKIIMDYDRPLECYRELLKNVFELISIVFYSKMQLGSNSYEALRYIDELVNYSNHIRLHFRYMIYISKPHRLNLTPKELMKELATIEKEADKVLNERINFEEIVDGIDKYLEENNV